MRRTALALLTACGVVAPPPPGVALVGARYAVAWDTSGVVAEPEGGWSVTNDLGYRLHVRAGRLVEHTVQLVACPPGPTPTASLWDLIEGTAVANHGLARDPSTVAALHVTDLVDPAPTALGFVRFPEARYCDVHWAVGREPTASTSEAVSGPSLKLEGTWTKGERSGTFAFEVDWFQGRSTPLEGAVAARAWEGARADGAPRTAVVHVRRALARLLDGYDPSTMIPVEGAWKAMVGLVDHTRVSVELAAGGGGDGATASR